MEPEKDKNNKVVSEEVNEKALRLPVHENMKRYLLGGAIIIVLGLTYVMYAKQKAVFEEYRQNNIKAAELLSVKKEKEINELFGEAKIESTINSAFNFRKSFDDIFFSYLKSLDLGPFFTTNNLTPRDFNTSSKMFWDLQKKYQEYKDPDLSHWDNYNRNKIEGMNEVAKSLISDFMPLWTYAFTPGNEENVKIIFRDIDPTKKDTFKYEERKKQACELLNREIPNLRVDFGC